MIKALAPCKPKVAEKLPAELEGLDDEGAADKLLERIGRDKGVFAQALAELLADDENDFEPPGYLRQAIEWATADAVFDEPAEATGPEADEPPG
jgi:hypothetical protein